MQQFNLKLLHTININHYSSGGSIAPLLSSFIIWPMKDISSISFLTRAVSDAGIGPNSFPSATRTSSASDYSPR